MTTNPVYLDFNATTPVRPEAIAAMTDALHHVGNASSVHTFGRAARKVVEDARAAVADLVNATPDRVVFTSGGTEADTLALKGLKPDRIVGSAIEHEAVMIHLGLMDRCPVDENGVLRLELLDKMLGEDAAGTIVSIMLANNETGVIQPVAEAARIAKAKGAWVHTDAIQAAGKIPVDFPALGVDLMSLSGHKIGGPQGIGAVVLAPDLFLDSVQKGGGQERGMRSGTENVPGIAGFGAAALAAKRDLAQEDRVRALRDRMEADVKARVPDAKIWGEAVPRLPNTSALCLPIIEAETQVMALDLAGVAISAGSACSSGKVALSHAIVAMGATPEQAKGTVRVSLGWTTTDDDVDRFVAAYTALYEKRRAA